MQPHARNKIFISYSHKDKRWRDELEIQLKPYLREGSIISWSDEQIVAGSQWFGEINSALTQKTVAVLLVTPDFLASDFIHEHESGPLLKEAEHGGVRILWVPVRDSAYKQTALKNYQAALDPNKPLATWPKAKRDQAWVKICEEINRAVIPSKEYPPEDSLNDAASARIDLSRLPQTSRDFLGRDDELERLDAAWSEATCTHMVVLVAPGGVGKTSLVKHWIERLKKDGWRGAERVYGWSFHSQGISDNRQVSDDAFLSDALRWFGIELGSAISP
jgi:TIR domain/AAA ATPase domain